jgi:hypothetical protein
MKGQRILNLFTNQKKMFTATYFFPKRSHTHPHHYNSSAPAYSPSSIVLHIKMLSFILNRIDKPTKYRLLFKSNV